MIDGAPRRIYFDLEYDIAVRMVEEARRTGKTQRAFIRDAIIAALSTTTGDINGKGKKQRT